MVAGTEDVYSKNDLIQFECSKQEILNNSQVP